MAKKKLDPNVRKKVKATLDRDLKLPQVAEVISHFVYEAGGPAKLGKMLWEEYKAATPGSTMRQRLLEQALRLLAGANQLHGAQRDVDGLDDKDLERELVDLLSGVSDAAVKDIKLDDPDTKALNEATVGAEES